MYADRGLFHAERTLHSAKNYSFLSVNSLSTPVSRMVFFLAMKMIYPPNLFQQ